MNKFCLIILPLCAIGAAPVITLMWDRVTKDMDGNPTNVLGYTIAVTKDLSITEPTADNPAVKILQVPPDAFGGVDIWPLLGEYYVTYTIWVNAYNSECESAWSLPIQARIHPDGKNDMTPPKAPILRGFKDG
jgi:hypothetical protein